MGLAGPEFGAMVACVLFSSLQVCCMPVHSLMLYLIVLYSHFFEVLPGKEDLLFEALCDLLSLLQDI